MKRTLLGGALALAMLAPFAAPAQAQVWRGNDYRNGRYNRYERNDRYGSLQNRADQIATRARRMHQSGRLTRDHLDRTLDKLDRNRLNANWLNQVENTLEEWSRSDSRRLR